ncbi:MAG: tetratricopeptide repeat protein [Woeseiaceae bacterium]
MTRKFPLKTCFLFAGFAFLPSVSAQQVDEEQAPVEEQDERSINIGDEAVYGDAAGMPEVDLDAELLDITDSALDASSPESLDNTAALSEEEQENLDRDELIRSFELYKSSIENGMYDEADTLAKRIVELSIKLYGINSHDSAKALTNLGIVQYHNKDFESAQLNYQAAIDIVERIEDRLHSGLMNPLKGLGAAQLSAGRPDLAKETFDRAVHVSHVNEGPHNLLQVEMLDALTETYLAIGDTKDAMDVQENAFNLQLRNIDPNSEEALPALQRQASWFHRMQHYNSERTAYRKIIRILESSRGKEDISLIRPLTGLGKSYLFVEPYDPEFQTYTPASGGEIYLKRALRIAEESPESDWLLMSSSMLALGDFYTLSGRASRARRTYGEAWEFLSSDEERLARRKDELESPIVLQDISPTVYYNSTRQDFGNTVPENFVQGTIVVGYTIDTYGQATNIAIVEARPPGLVDMEYEVTRSVRDLIHRPRYKDGEIIEIDDATYTHEFFYRPTDLPDDSADPTLAGSAASGSGR